MLDHFVVSLVDLQASPYSVSLARFIASSSVLKVLTVSTGPNISSFQIGLSDVGCKKSVG